MYLLVHPTAEAPAATVSPLLRAADVVPAEATPAVMASVQRREPAAAPAAEPTPHR